MHKNARLTPKGRELMLARLQAGQHRLDVAQAMGVSLTTLKKWLGRYNAEGQAGLADRSSRPRHSPRQLLTGTVCNIVALRRQRRTGALYPALWASRLPLSRASCVASGSHAGGSWSLRSQWCVMSANIPVS